MQQAQLEAFVQGLVQTQVTHAEQNLARNVEHSEAVWNAEFQASLTEAEMRQHRSTVNAEMMQAELHMQNQRSESHMAILRGELFEAQARLSAPPTVAPDLRGTIDPNVLSKIQNFDGRDETGNRGVNTLR